MPLPGGEKISKLIDALRDYAVNSARLSCEGQMTDAYRPSSLSSWDAFMWFELAQDWELSDFLVSGSDKAKKLVNSLQSCLQWYGQNEIEEIHLRSKIMSMIN